MAPPVTRRVAALLMNPFKIDNHFLVNNGIKIMCFTKYPNAAPLRGA